MANLSFCNNFQIRKPCQKEEGIFNVISSLSRTHIAANLCRKRVRQVQSKLLIQCQMKGSDWNVWFFHERFATYDMRAKLMSSCQYTCYRVSQKMSLSEFFVTTTSAAWFQCFIKCFCDQYSYSYQNTRITEAFCSPCCPKMSQICTFQSPSLAKKDQCTHTSWVLLFDQIYYAEIDDFSTLDIFTALF